MPSSIERDQDMDQDHSDYYDDEGEILTNLALLSLFSLTDQIYVAAEQIKNMMSENCDEKTKRISVKVPIQAINKFGIGSLSLNDPSCGPETSPTHWTLSSHSTGCGAIALTYGSSPMYRNNVRVKFTSGPLAGQKTK